MRVYMRLAVKRLANETFRFTKSRSRPGSHANGAVNPRNRMLISPSLHVPRDTAILPSVRVPQILLHGVDVAVLKAMAVKRHSRCSRPDLISRAYSAKTSWLVLQTVQRNWTMGDKSWARVKVVTVRSVIAVNIPHRLSFEDTIRDNNMHV